MRDVILVTVECARWDHRDCLDLPQGFDVQKGVAAGHYTRPSLAGLLTGQYRSVIDTRCRSPTLAEALADLGYQTAAISFSPQTTTAFGFDRGFDCHHFLRAESGALSRGSNLRERLAESSLVRAVKSRLADKHATFEDIPHDDFVVGQAQGLLQRQRDAPLFLWAHFMGSHRPYGWGEAGLNRSVSRRAATATPSGRSTAASADLRDAVAKHYRRGLERTGERVRALLDAASDDAVLVVVGDHGEELGESGYFFHGGYRRRLVDELVEVPVWTRGLAIGTGKSSLLDLPAHILAGLRESPPDEWDAATRRDHCLSIAPWHDTASLRYQADGVDITLADGDIDRVDASVGRDVERQLQALGYADVG